MIGYHCVTIDADEIYFFTGLSHRGANISLFGHRTGGDTTYGYLQRFCGATPPKDGRIDI